MLVFMIRGLFKNLKFPYVQFLASSTKGAQSFPLLSVTCDGASDNGRMYTLHETGMKLTYKTVKIFSADRNSYCCFRPFRFNRNNTELPNVPVLCIV